MVDIKLVQSRLLEMGKIIAEILENNEIKYMIAFGTLLGAVRHQGFIPWDDDFDIFIFDEQYDLAIECLRKELPKSLFLEDEKSEPLYYHGWAHVKDTKSNVVCEKFPQDSLYSHHGLSIDLFRTYRMHFDKLHEFINNENKKYIERRKLKGTISLEEYEKRIKKLMEDIETPNEHENDTACVYSMNVMYKTKHMREEDIFPLKKYEFEDTYFWGPNNADGILKSIYGDYMTLPPVDKRVTHYSQVEFN